MKEGLDSGEQVLEVTISHSPEQDNFAVEFRRRGYTVEFEKTDNLTWVVTVKK